VVNPSFARFHGRCRPAIAKGRYGIGLGLGCELGLGLAIGRPSLWRPQIVSAVFIQPCGRHLLILVVKRKIQLDLL